jgi:hypothetical protein
MVDLLIKQVTEGLSPAERRALDALDGAVAGEWAKDLERAAAAIALAGSAHAAAPPAALIQQVEAEVRAFFQGAGATASAPGRAPVGVNVVDMAAARAAAAERAGGASESGAAPSSKSRSGAYGWFAAAACLVLALFAWVRSPTPPPVAAVTPPPAVIAPPVVTPPAPPSLAEERAALMAKSDSLKITLAATKDPGAAGVTGDVVWDPATQRGYMHFTGLAANDPAVHQYQLWIFDGGRDKRYPVDGGVFDIPANASEVVIPIRAALMVRKPAAFAVTIEKPGGAVVSGREHVVVLGAAG